MVGAKTWKEILVKVKYNASPKSVQPAVDQGLNVKYAAAKRGGFKGRWYLLLLLVIAPLVIALWILLRPKVLILASGIITTEPLEVRAYTKGVLASLEVKKGQQLAPHSVMLTMTDPQLAAKIETLEHQLNTLNQDAPLLNESILNQLRNRVLVAREGVERQNNVLKVYQDYELSNKGLISIDKMAMAQQAHTSSQIALETAKADLLLEQQRQQIAKTAGVVSQSRNRIELALASLKAMQSQLIVSSPFSSQVADILVQSGEHIAEGQPLILLSGRDSPVVFSYLEPKHLEYAQMGQQASITLPNGQQYRAKVSEPTELVERLPQQLANPFDGAKPVLRVTLRPEANFPVNIEGIPVEVSFDYWR